LDWRPERSPSTRRQENTTPQDLRKVVFTRMLGKDNYPRLKAGEAVFIWRPGKDNI